MIGNIETYKLCCFTNLFVSLQQQINITIICNNSKYTIDSSHINTNNRQESTYRKNMIRNMKSREATPQLILCYEQRYSLSIILVYVSLLLVGFVFFLTMSFFFADKEWSVLLDKRRKLDNRNKQTHVQKHDINKSQRKQDTKA